MSTTNTTNARTVRGPWGCRYEVTTRTIAVNLATDAVSYAGAEPTETAEALVYAASVRFQKAAGATATDPLTSLSLGEFWARQNSLLDENNRVAVHQLAIALVRKHFDGGAGTPDGDVFEMFDGQL